jgi:hypothetical protein
MPGMPGAGAIRSSLADMEIFLRAQMNLTSNMPQQLRLAIARAKKNLPNAEADLDLNLCSSSNSNTITCNKAKVPIYEGYPADQARVTFFHAGETGSSQSMFMMSQDGEVGAIILTNSIPTARDAKPSHFPNDFSICVMQLAGKPLADVDTCNRF